MQVILDAARLLGWMAYHTHDSRKSEPGFPDIIAVRGGRVLAIECKRERGRVRPEQVMWVEALSEVPGVTAMIARPSQWDEVETLLRET